MTCAPRTPANAPGRSPRTAVLRRSERYHVIVVRSREAPPEISTGTSLRLRFARGSIALPRWVFLALTIAAVGLAPRSGAQGQPQGLRVLSREGLRPLATVTQNNQEYVALDDVAQLFGLTVREDQLAGGLTITSGTRSIIVTPDQPVVSVAGRLVSLPAPPFARAAGGSCRDFLARAVGRARDRLDLRRSARLLIVGDLRVPRVVARVDRAPGTVAVTFDITPPAPREWRSQPAGWSCSSMRTRSNVASARTAAGIPAGLQPGETPTTVRLTPGPRFACIASRRHSRIRRDDW